MDEETQNELDGHLDKPSGNRKVRPIQRQDPLKNTMNWVHFFGGFIGWFVVNSLIYTIGYDLFCLAIPLNLFGLIIFAVFPRTRTIAFGILAANAINFFISIFIGMFFNSLCFVPFYMDFVYSWY